MTDTVQAESLNKAIGTLERHLSKCDPSPLSIADINQVRLACMGARDVIRVLVPMAVVGSTHTRDQHINADKEVLVVSLTVPKGTVLAEGSNLATSPKCYCSNADTYGHFPDCPRGVLWSGRSAAQARTSDDLLSKAQAAVATLDAARQTWINATVGDEIAASDAFSEAEDAAQTAAFDYIRSLGAKK